MLSRCFFFKQKTAYEVRIVDWRSDVCSSDLEGVSKEDAKLHAQQIAGSYTSSRRPESNFMSLGNLLGPVKVVANEDGTITATLALGAGGAPKKWREVAPYLWQDTTSTDRLAVDVVDGKVDRKSTRLNSSH